MLTRYSRVGLAVVLLGVSAILGIKADATASAAGTFVTLSPAQQSVAMSAGTVTYQVNVANVDDVATYGFDLKFDPNVLEFQSAVDGPFLASSGRQVECLDAVLLGNKDTVRYGCGTIGDYTPGSGAAGTGLLATLTFKVIGGGTSPLTFIKMDLEDVTNEGRCGNLILCTPQDATGGSITVDGPVLPTATPDPNATPTVPAALPTSSGGGITNNTTPASGNGTGGTSSTGTQSGATGSASAGAAASGSSSSSGGNSTGADGAPSGVTGADSGQTGSTNSGTRSGGASASSAGGAGAGVGKFGSGPDSYAADGARPYRNGALVFAALGVLLMATGVWRKMVHGGRAG